VKPALVDTHAHIQGEEFSQDIDSVVARASEAGVEQIVVPGVDVETSRAAIALAARWESVYATAGFHPHEASRLDEVALAVIEAMLADAKVVAVGEIGLDYHYEHSPRDAQIRCFAQMLELAQRHGMPIVVHCREAWEHAATLLAPWSRRVRETFSDRPVGVMHYFSGTLDQARFYIGLGFMISVHTSVTHKKQAALREVVSQLPLESLVIETDSPYGAPQAYRGKRNEPSYVAEAVRQAASELGLPFEAVAAATSANAALLFDLPVVVPPEGASR